MKSKVLYLHVGADKTGSTFIQSLLYENHSILEKFGYLYPEPRGREKDASSLYSHHLIATFFSKNPEALDFYMLREGKFSSAEIVDEASKYMEYLDALIRKNSGNMILSYEGLDALSKDELSALNEYFSKYFDEIKVIYYLKPYLSYAVSAMSQRIRFGRPSWFVHPPVNTYSSKLDILSSIFGKSNLILRKFSSKFFVNGSFSDDFLSLIGFKGESELDFSMSVARNASLSGLAIRLGDAILYYFRDSELLRNIEFYKCFAKYLEKLDGPSYVLSSLQRLVIEKTVAIDSQKILNEYGLDLMGQNFDNSYRTVASAAEIIDPALISDVDLDSLARYFIMQELPEFSFDDRHYKYIAEAAIKRRSIGTVNLISYDFDSATEELKLTFSIHNLSKYDWVGHILPFQAVIEITGMGNEAELRVPFPYEGLLKGHEEIFKCSVPFAYPNGAYGVAITAVQDHVKWLHKSGLKKSNNKFIKDESGMARR